MIALCTDCEVTWSTTHDYEPLPDGETCWCCGSSEHVVDKHSEAGRKYRPRTSL